MARDIPEEKRQEISKWAKRKSLDIKWVANSFLTPEMERIYLSLIENAFKIGALQWYIQCMKDYHIDEDNSEDDD